MRADPAHHLVLGRAFTALRQGSYSEAALEFSKLDKVDHPEVQQHVLLGRGIANTFLGHKDKALKDLTKGTERYPHVADFWRRRAHLLASMGRQADALSDYSRALELEPNHPETIQERGVLAFQAGDFWTAISDLTAALKRQPKDPMLIRAVALSYGGAGQWREAVEVMEEAVRRHPGVALLWSDKGRAHKELGQADLAVAALHKALALEESPEAYLRLGLQLQSIGDHRDAIKYAHKGLKLRPMDIELNYLEASSLHAVGNYNAAIKQYSVILTLPAQAASEYAQVQQSLAFYQRDIATYTWSKLTRPFIDFQIDQDLDTNFKEAWIRRLPPTVLPRSYHPLDLPPGARSKGKSPGLPELSEGALEIIAKADEIGSRTQYFLDGFMPNKRQFRMAGLAALDVMQQVRTAWEEMAQEGEDGGTVEGGVVENRGEEAQVAEDDSESTQKQKDDRSPTSRQGTNPESIQARRRTSKRGKLKRRAFTDSFYKLTRGDGRKGEKGAKGGLKGRAGGKGGGRLMEGWRDVFNVIVPWRQIGEPTDLVAWIDLLENEIERGYGGLTALQVGQMQNVKYYPLKDRTLEVVKQRLLDAEEAVNATGMTMSSKSVHGLMGAALGGKFSIPRAVYGEKIKQAESVKELHTAVGCDFFINSQCLSEAIPGKAILGTEFSIVASARSFDFAIRTSVDWPRWKHLDLELTAAWEALCAAVLDAHTEAADPHRYRQRIQDAILRLGYFWYQFMPLTRGSAMVGLISVLGLSLAADMETTAFIPKGVQVDWEALLSPSFAKFNDSVAPWLYEGTKLFKLLSPPSPSAPPPPACGSPSSGRGEKLLLGGADLCALMRADGGKSGLAGGGRKGAAEESKGELRGAVGSSGATVEKKGKRGDASERGGHGGEQKKGRGGSGDPKRHETTRRRKGEEEEGEDEEERDRGLKGREGVKKGRREQAKPTVKGSESRDEKGSGGGSGGVGEKGKRGEGEGRGATPNSSYVPPLPNRGLILFPQMQAKKFQEAINLFNQVRPPTPLTQPPHDLLPSSVIPIHHTTRNLLTTPKFIEATNLFNQPHYTALNPSPIPPLRLASPSHYHIPFHPALSPLPPCSLPATGGSGRRRAVGSAVHRQGPLPPDAQAEGDGRLTGFPPPSPRLSPQVEAEGGELSDQLFIGRGLCHLFLKRLDDAEDDFTEGIQHFPRSAELYRRRAMLYIERNERETVRVHVDVEGAVEDLSRSLEIEPDNQDALQHRGIIAFHIHLYSMAIACNPMQLSPCDPLSTPFPLYPCPTPCPHAGIIAFHIHLYGMAIADLSRALDMRPMDAYLIRAKAIDLGGGRPPAQRERHVQRGSEAPCLTLQSTLPFLPPPSSPLSFPPPFPPSSPHSSSPQGIALTRAGHCRNASSMFSEAGIALAGAGQWRNVSTIFSEVVRQLVMPGLLVQPFPSPLTSLSTLPPLPSPPPFPPPQGIALAGAGQWRNASAVFAEAVKRHPMSAHLWTEKGRVHKELGEVDLALAALHKALALEDTLEAYIRLTSLMQLVGRHNTLTSSASVPPYWFAVSITHSLSTPPSLSPSSSTHAQLHQYSNILGLSPTDSNTGTLQGMAFYQREIAAYTLSKLDLPFSQFRLDYELHNELKEAWVRKQSPLSILPAYRPLPIRLVRNPPRIRFSPQVRALIAKADEIGRRTQYFVDGFMPHKR
ncbi:unnamed protein product [Closterium sp. Naga37s-1]|nr:unnamed protein product [Closterium sp. Naga37s-1]